MSKKNIKQLVYTALFAALIYVTTYVIKVPSVVTNGYTHLGDGFIFLAVILLGRKNGAIAAAIGASLSDLLGGYSHYIIPTFIIKFVMAYIMGFIIDKNKERKYSWLIGALVGSVWQIIAYYIVGSVFMGSFISTLLDIPANCIQSAFGIIIAFLLGNQLKKFIKIDE
ncbi:ECF transporter S component [Sedimentibacter sp. zth1]|uniref:ECF transporter S component n=1 Tax=Sedimentibacter sp. zth1 TaxID=2816908 RepID=UPI001A91EDD4|nr:ECF transporter S component [Sedimentibacter sp. zth1]QSX06379.1 ECF transporter S component [Sedimentibacter sp. zth1]